MPQVEHAPEVSIEPIDNATFRVPGASSEKFNVTVVDGIDPCQTVLTGMNAKNEESDEGHAGFCMMRLDTTDLKGDNKAPKFGL